MVKEPEGPGQKFTIIGTCQKCGHLLPAHESWCMVTSGVSWPFNQRQLSCGCWVSMDWVSACPVHGAPVATEALARALNREPTREELQQTIRLLKDDVAHLAEQIRRGHHEWLDEVAARLMARMMPTFEEVRCSTDDEVAIGIHIAQGVAYDAAQALLDEGKKRREAKGE